jgi:hypothetical protein
MDIEIVSFTPDHIGAVRDFNHRLEKAGASWKFFETPEPVWIPKRPGQTVWREYFLAVDESAAVRGAYCLKPQEFLVRGRGCRVASWQPLSEAIVDKRYSAVALHLMRDLLKREPLFFSWGASEPLANMLRSMGWFSRETPFCFRILRPFRFLRRNAYLRNTVARRVGLDALAYSGLGWAGIRALNAGLDLRSRPSPRCQAEEVTEFGSWADEVWDRSAKRYSLIAVRDARTMNTLLPTDGSSKAIRLRIVNDDQLVGWAAVLDTQMKVNKRFGSMRLGTIIDFLAAPEDAQCVISAALAFLEKRDVDMVCAHLSNPHWIQGFADNGFVVSPRRRFFAVSKALEKKLEPMKEALSGIHLTLLDGDGPRGF